MRTHGDGKHVDISRKCGRKVNEAESRGYWHEVVMATCVPFHPLEKKVYTLF